MAKISANNDQVIGDLIATAVDKVGKGGSVTIEKSCGRDSTSNSMSYYSLGVGIKRQL